jgi:hypothetical protein
MGFFLLGKIILKILSTTTEPKKFKFTLMLLEEAKIKFRIELWPRGVGRVHNKKQTNKQTNRLSMFLRWKNRPIRLM